MDEEPADRRPHASGSRCVRVDANSAVQSALEAADNAELVLWTISSEVVEMFWDGGETFPNRVIKDSVLN